jgi:alpha-L-rhamnosidase
MHAGIPSDCPHIERRGYTGDGQLICHAAMDILDARAFYHKWIADIGDCQDTLTGHVQYTAPYTRCGGGPGGWGCAIVEVPWQYYLHYGDIEPAARLYPQMLRYFDFLEEHSDGKLVTSDKAGQWCLGDWCTPIQVALPAPFVNNYFYIRSLQRTVEIARLTGHEEDIPMLEKRIAERRAAVKAAYFNTWDSNFIGGLQGANAFALDMGVGDETTFANMVKYYTADGCYDTGIFGTEIVTRVLFERGAGDLAATLMTARTGNSYAGMRDAGATTLWEYWPAGNHIRSLNHPMFGAVAACLFDWLLGMQGTPVYTALRLAPVLPACLNFARGKRVLPTGEVAVAWEKKDGEAVFTVTVPEGVPAVLVFGGKEYPLTAGENRITAAL